MRHEGHGAQRRLAHLAVAVVLAGGSGAACTGDAVTDGAPADDTGTEAVVGERRWDLTGEPTTDAVGWPGERTGTQWEVPEGPLTIELPANRTLTTEGRVAVRRDTLATDRITVVMVFDAVADAAAARERAVELADRWGVDPGDRFDRWVADGGRHAASSGTGSADPLAPGGPTPTVHVRRLGADGSHSVMLELYWPPPRTERTTAG